MSNSRTCFEVVLFSQVTKCIETGTPLLIESMPENIDPVLDPIIGKRTFKRGRLTMVKIGDAEIEFNPKFRQEIVLIALKLLSCPRQ